MKRWIVLGHLVTCVFLFAWCGPVESPATVTRWLDSRAGAPAINVAGAWTDNDWGSTYFQQDGNRLSGKLGAYVVYGSISGTVLSLAIYHGGELRYTATLQMTQNGVLLGQYYRTTLQEEGWPIMLKRAS